MYSKRSPPTVPTGIEFPNISMPGMCGIAPSTGIKRSRKYSSILGTVYAFVIASPVRQLSEERYTTTPPASATADASAPLETDSHRCQDDRCLGQNGVPILR